MKNIVSFHIQPDQISLKDILYLYVAAKDSDNHIYLYKDGKACRINSVSEFISFIITSHQKLLVIVEGESARTTMNYLVKKCFGTSFCEKVI